LRHGYYPKGGGKVKVEIGSIEKGQPIQLSQPGRVIKVEGLSLASKALQEKRVAERQAEAARRALEKLLSCPLDLKYDYVDTYSVGTEINLWAHTDTGAILWADRRGELKKKAEEVGKEAGQALWQEIEGGAACDFRLADNLIPWLALLGGEIKTSQISLHTQTNIWVCEQFLGKIFAVEGTTVRCRQGQKID
jgi:RNA 3'-terminal phosphate cyclase